MAHYLKKIQINCYRIPFDFNIQLILFNYYVMCLINQSKDLKYFYTQSSTDRNHIELV